MRGIDYRSNTALNLLITTPLSSKRMFKQACGRVNRFGDRGVKAIMQGVENFDKIQQLRLIGDLGVLIDEIKASKTQPRKTNPKAEDATKVSLSEVSKAKGRQDSSRVRQTNLASFYSKTSEAS